MDKRIALIYGLPSITFALLGAWLFGSVNVSILSIGLEGAIRSMVLVSTKIEKEAYIATPAVIVMAMDVSRISVYLASSGLYTQYHWYIISLVAVAFMGARMGIRLLKQLPG